MNAHMKSSFGVTSMLHKLTWKINFINVASKTCMCLCFIILPHLVNFVHELFIDSRCRQTSSKEHYIISSSLNPYHHPVIYEY